MQKKNGQANTLKGLPEYKTRVPEQISGSNGSKSDHRPFPAETRMANAKALQSALRRRERAVKANPAEAANWFDYGKMLLEIGRNREAEEALRESFRRPPTSANYRYYLGEALGNNGKFDEAASHFEFLAEVDPKLLDPMSTIGLSALTDLAYCRGDWGAGHEEGIARTNAALRERKPVFEAGLQHGQTHARADILRPAARGAWDLIEVKSSGQVKEEHYDDVAFQKHVDEGAGVRVGRCFVMHVDKTYVRQGKVEADRLLTLADVTQEIKPLKSKVPAEVKSMLSVMAREKCPDAPIGTQCSGCDLYDDCWSFLPRRSVFSLHRIGSTAYKLMEQGILKTA